MIRLFQKNTFDYADWHRAIVATLSCFCAVIVTMLFHINLYATLWFVLAATLACLSIQGQNKLQQSFNLIILAICSTASLLLITFAIGALSYWLMLCMLFIATLCFLTLPRYSAYFTMPGLLAIVFMVAGASFSLPHDVPLHALFMIDLITIFAGVLITLIINLLLPRVDAPAPPVDQTAYFYKRNFRLCLGVIIAFLIAKIFHLQHASWICFAIIFVSKTSLGTSIQRGIERLSGTVLGVVLGIPAAIWLFPEHLWFHWCLFAILFFAWLTIMKRYFLGMLLFTFIIAAGYYILFPTGHNGIAFILYRLLDTLVGVSIAFLLEMTVFPLSLRPCIRDHHFTLWQNIYKYFAQLPTADADDINCHIDTLQSTMQTIEDLLVEIKFEPVGGLTAKYYMTAVLIQQLRLLIDRLPYYQKNICNAQSFNHEDYHKMVAILQSLTEVQTSSLNLALLKTLAAAEHNQTTLCQSLMQTNNNESRNDAFIELNQALLTIISQYYHTRKTPQWKLSFGKKPIQTVL